MKIIISHDIDHITAWEHNKNTIIPRFIIRSTFEFIIRSISMQEYVLRYNDIFKNKWQNLEELMEFDKINNIPATFFIGVENATGMSYSLKDAEFWTKKIISNGFDTGVQGIAFNNLEKIKKEHSLFKLISGLDKFGIRIHYLKHDNKLLNFLDRAGYLFDSTIYTVDNCYKVGGLWEFPLHMMDVYLLYSGKRWQAQSFDSIKAYTKKSIDAAFKKNLPYLTILFHDRYFSDSFKTLKEWYVWLISYLKDNHFTFISYKDAILEMEKN